MTSLASDAASVWTRFVQFAPRRIPRMIDRTVQKLRTRPVVDDVDFDAIHGTDTRQVIKVYKLDAVSPAYIHSHGYDACDIVRLRRDLLYLPISPRGYEFVDVGCGKGRALIFAAEMGFRKVTGVEISPMLAEVASKNLEICGIEGAILVEDAATFAIPEAPCVCYLYDPFGKSVMRQFVKNVEQRLKRSVADLWIIYRGPLHGRVLESSSALKTCDRSFDSAFYRRRAPPPR
jgi:SAM-dependent methyltransferase